MTLVGHMHDMYVHFVKDMDPSPMYLKTVFCIGLERLGMSIK